MFSKPTSLGLNSFRKSSEISRLGGYRKLGSAFDFGSAFNHKNMQLFQQIRCGLFNRGKSEIEQIQKAKKDALSEMGDKYVYDKPSFTVVNNDKFLEKIKKIEEQNKDTKAKIDGFKFPLLLVFFTLFIYYQWETIPYNVVFKHATISEYIPREHYFHAIFTGNLIVYGPALLYSLYLCGIYMKQRHMFYLFASNALVTCGVTFLYERSKNQPVPMLTPKAHGAVTPLAFMSAFLAIKPDYCIMGSRTMPFFLIPTIYLMYECYEYKNYYVNEVCRPAHISAMAYGLLFGLIFRKFKL